MTSGKRRMPKTGDSVVAKQRSGWDKVASWAGISNNREGNIRMKDEATMQDEAVANGEFDAVMNAAQEGGEERGGVDAAREGSAQPEGVAQQDGAAQEIAQLRGEKDQLLDRLARLQAE